MNFVNSDFAEKRMATDHSQRGNLFCAECKNKSYGFVQKAELWQAN
jgi:hypothetical protein